MKRGVQKEIVDKIIKFDYKGLHTQCRQYFDIGWQAYRDDDMTHPIFGQGIHGIRGGIDLGGLGKDFVAAMNLLSTRLGCKNCGGTTKMSL